MPEPEGHAPDDASAVSAYNGMGTWQHALIHLELLRQISAAPTSCLHMLDTSADNVDHYWQRCGTAILSHNNNCCTSLSLSTHICGHGELRVKGLDSNSRFRVRADTKSQPESRVLRYNVLSTKPYRSYRFCCLSGIFALLTSNCS